MRTRRRDFLAVLAGSAALPSLSHLLRADTLPAHVSSAQLAADPRRPQYHFLPAANWMNDPNGPIYWNGKYHMFYQYNPGGAYWGDMHWGHAVSPDMVHWRHLPVALAPTPGSPDADGCFTGTAVIEDGRVNLLYTGVRAASLEEATIKDAVPPLRETQRLAVALDSDLMTWQKDPAPVIAAPPPQFQVNGFRDPSPWRQGDWWYLVCASGLANQGGAVFLYRAKDLRNWEFMHVLADRDRSGAAAFASFDPWEVWECPEFFPLGEWHVLIFSTAGKTWYQSGKLDEGSMTFHPQRAGVVDYGSFYAAKTQLDKAGNRIIWGWVPETRPLAEYKAAGWAGLMSLPRVLSIASDGQLRWRIASEVEQLRTHPQSLTMNADAGSMQRPIKAMRIAECCGEFECVARRQNQAFNLILRTDSAAKTPAMTVGYDPRHADQISIDGRPVPLSSNHGNPLKIGAHIDASVIELLVNDEIAWTKRFYDPHETPTDLLIEWEGDPASIVRLDKWQYSPISSNRLTA